MKYLDGKEIIMRDWVWCNEGVNIGVVSLVLETEEQRRDWGLAESGLFVCFDLSEKSLAQEMFVAEKEFEDEGVGPLTGAESSEIRELHEEVCRTDPEAVNEPYGVLRHKACMGIPWIFDVGDRHAKGTRSYGFSTAKSIQRLSRDQVFDPLQGGPPSRGAIEGGGS